MPKTRWEKCTDCQSRLKSQGLDNCDSLQSYFVNRISKFITEKRGKIVLGWDEILEGGALPKGAIVQSWRGTAGGIEAVRSGHAAIISPTSHCYFDYPISKYRERQGRVNGVRNRT